MAQTVDDDDDDVHEVVDEDEWLELSASSSCAHTAVIRPVASVASDCSKPMRSSVLRAGHGPTRSVSDHPLLTIGESSLLRVSIRGSHLKLALYVLAFSLPI